MASLNKNLNKEYFCLNFLLHILFETGWAWTIKCHWENQTGEAIKTTLILFVDTSNIKWSVLLQCVLQWNCFKTKKSAVTNRLQDVPGKQIITYCFYNLRRKGNAVHICRAVNKFWSRVPNLKVCVIFLILY